jgi:hypothetical protein
MPRVLTAFLLTGLLAAGPTVALAEQVSLVFGGDSYAAGQNASIVTPVAHDAFMAGYSIALTAPVTGDAHLAGYNVGASSSIGGDLYAAGYAVTISGSVGGDVTAVGNSVLLQATSALPGNARLAGQTVLVDAPIQGSAITSAETLTLNTAISGDFTFYGRTLTFGPNAVVAGKVAIHAPREIAVPATVAAADRVSFELLVDPDYLGEAGRTAENVVKGFWPMLWGQAIWGLLLFVVGALFIAFGGRLVAALQTVSEKRPFRRIGLGILAFASVVGLVPVVALTLIGLLVVPFVLIFAFAACVLAYIAGSYFAASNIGAAFLKIDSNAKRLGALAAGLIVAALVSMVPFIGWLITLALVTFGFGTIAALIMVRWSGPDATRLAASAAAPQPAE